MAKQTGQAQHPKTADDVGHLDESLSDVASSAVDKLKRYGPYLLGGAVLIALIMGAVTAIHSLGESSLAENNSRLWRHVQSSDARRSDAAVNLPEIDALVNDVRGSDAERYFLKTIGNFFLSHAERSGDTPAAPGLPRDTARERALSLADRALESFPDDPDLRKWAEGVKAVLAAAADRSWLPAPEPEPEAPEEADSTADASAATTPGGSGAETTPEPAAETSGSAAEGAAPAPEETAPAEPPTVDAESTETEAATPPPPSGN